MFTSKILQGTCLRLLISAFIVFHLTLIVCWMFPQFSWQRIIDARCRSYILFWGLDQDYQVFAPSPRAANITVLGIVTYGDGTMAIWQFPQMEDLSLTTKIWKERFRKFVDDNLASSSDVRLKQDVARYIARNSMKPGQGPLMVSLIRLSAEIPPPALGLGHELPPNSSTKTLINYEVLPEDLQ
jgi:hypothetical protein